MRQNRLGHKCCPCISAIKGKQYAVEIPHQPGLFAHVRHLGTHDISVECGLLLMPIEAGSGGQVTALSWGQT